MVNVGNPHFVLFPEREDFGSHGLSWQELGATDQRGAPLFRFGTNVEFVRVLREGTTSQFRIFERGCGPTESSRHGNVRLSGSSHSASRGRSRVC